MEKREVQQMFRFLYNSSMFIFSQISDDWWLRYCPVNDDEIGDTVLRHFWIMYSINNIEVQKANRLGNEHNPDDFGCSNFIRH